MLNQVHLIGNVGAEPEVKQVNESKVVRLSLATSETFKDKSGNKQTETQWHNVQAWGALADIIEKYVKKGDKIYIGGSVKYRQWEKDGAKHYATEIKGTEIIMLGGKSEKKQSTPVPEIAETENDSLPF